MKLKFFDSNKLEKPHRLAVHRSGKLGFTIEAAKALKLSPEKSIAIAVNAEDENDKSLYMVVHPQIVTGAFKVSKAGIYYYLPIKLLLDNLKIPYASGSVVFTMEKVESDYEELYRLSRYEKEENKPKNKLGGDDNNEGKSKRIMSMLDEDQELIEGIDENESDDPNDEYNK